MGLLDLFKRTRATRATPRPVEDRVHMPRGVPAPVEAAPESPAAPPPDPAELRRMLFDAVATGDEEKLSRLCRAHHNFLIESADTWSIVPDALSANPDAARWYGEGLQAIARFCAEQYEHPELQDRPRGDGEPREIPGARDRAGVYAA